MDRERFASLAENYKKITNLEGIGTLQEKTLHKVLKNYLEPNLENQEIKIGPYYVDIFRDNEIIEIQTRQFNKLRNKLDYLLDLYNLTLCYPIINKKTINWLDPQTLQVEDERKSPKRGRIYDVFFELYKIKNFLKHPNLNLKLIIVDVLEYKLLNGWNESKKRGAERYDQIPVRLIGEVNIRELLDYSKFLPCELGLEFTSRDYAKITKIRLRDAQLALNILRYLGLVEVVGKSSRSYLYSLKEEADLCLEI